MILSTRPATPAPMRTMSPTRISAASTVTVSLRISAPFWGADRHVEGVANVGGVAVFPPPQLVDGCPDAPLQVVDPVLGFLEFVARLVTHRVTSISSSGA